MKQKVAGTVFILTGDSSVWSESFSGSNEEDTYSGTDSGSESDSQNASSSGTLLEQGTASGGVLALSLFSYSGLGSESGSASEDEGGSWSGQSYNGNDSDSTTESDSGSWTESALGSYSNGSWSLSSYVLQGSSSTSLSSSGSESDSLTEPGGSHQTIPNPEQFSRSDTADSQDNSAYYQSGVMTAGNYANSSYNVDDTSVTSVTISASSWIDTSTDSWSVTAVLLGTLSGVSATSSSQYGFQDTPSHGGGSGSVNLSQSWSVPGLQLDLPTPDNSVVPVLDADSPMGVSSPDLGVVAATGDWLSGAGEMAQSATQPNSAMPLVPAPGGGAPVQSPLPLVYVEGSEVGSDVVMAFNPASNNPTIELLEVNAAPGTAPAGQANSAVKAPVIAGVSLAGKDPYTQATILVWWNSLSSEEQQKVSNELKQKGTLAKQQDYLGTKARAWVVDQQKQGNQLAGVVQAQATQLGAPPPGNEERDTRDIIAAKKWQTSGARALERLRGSTQADWEITSNYAEQNRAELKKKKEELRQFVVKTSISFVPIAGQLVALGEAAYGKDIFGNDLSTTERLLTVGASALPVIARVVGRAVKQLPKTPRGASIAKELQDAEKALRAAKTPEEADAAMRSFNQAAAKATAELNAAKAVTAAKSGAPLGSEPKPKTPPPPPPPPPPPKTYPHDFVGPIEPGAVRAPAPKSVVEKVNPADIRFSQNTAGGRGRADVLRQSMGEKGWAGDPVDAVRTPDGITTIDNTRVAVARELGIKEIPVRVHAPNEPLPPEMLAGPNPRFGTAKTWGEALEFRTANQKPPLPPTGTLDAPRLPKPKN